MKSQLQFMRILLLCVTFVVLVSPEQGYAKIFVDGNDYSLPENFYAKGNGPGTSGELIVDNPSMPGVYFENVPEGIDDIETNKIDGTFDLKDGTSGGVVAVGDDIENAGTADMWISLAGLLVASDDATTTTDSIVSYSDLPNNSTFGTRVDPQVTIVTEYDTLSSNSRGAGILIIEAGAKISGNFSFEGIVIYLTDGVADENADPDNNQGSGNDMGNTTKLSTGSSSIYGSMIIAGKNPFLIEIGGNSSLRYSSEAIETVKTLLEGLGESFAPQTVAQITSWKVL